VPASVGPRWHGSARKQRAHVGVGGNFGRAGAERCDGREGTARIDEASATLYGQRVERSDGGGAADRKRREGELELIGRKRVVRRRDRLPVLLVCRYCSWPRAPARGTS
jgi:hypothetical protein